MAESTAAVVRVLPVVYRCLSCANSARRGKHRRHDCDRLVATTTPAGDGRTVVMRCTCPGHDGRPR